MAFDEGTPTEEPKEEKIQSYEEGLTETVDQEKFLWVDVVGQEVLTSMGYWARENGYSLGAMKSVYNQHAQDMFEEMSFTFRGSQQAIIKRGSRLEEFTGSPEGIQRMIDWGINWMGGKLGADLSKVSRTSGSRGGGGRRGPTAEEIRNQFDVEALARSIDELNQSLVFEKHKDAKHLARKYVDAVVAGKGEKKIDFENFVRTNIEGSNRFKAIYRNKPEGMQAEQYMQPYFQAALQRLRPDDAQDVAIGAAQFGASPEAFRGRVEREQRVEGQAPFIQGMEGRLQELSSILKG